MQSLEENGFAVVHDVLDARIVANLLAVIESYCTPEAEDSGRAIHAIRNLFEVLPELVNVLNWQDICALIKPILGKYAPVVRTIYFDKQPGANWKVPWHQDQAIAVKKRIQVAGFGPWSIKDGVHHVEPPVSILEKMLTVRLHLDDCSGDNGPLRVIPGSHKMGRLTPDDVDPIKNANGEVACTVNAGGAVLMRPLLLHASSPSESPTHRRVIHIEFAACNLPGGLEWATPLTTR